VAAAARHAADAAGLGRRRRHLRRYGPVWAALASLGVGSVSLSGHLTRLDSTGELIGGDATHPADHRRNAVIFGAACRSCPLRQRCTTAKHGRTLHLHEHEGLLRTARAEWAGLRRDYMTPRPQVERAIAQVATRRGRRFSSLPRSDQ